MATAVSPNIVSGLVVAKVNFSVNIYLFSFHYLAISSSLQLVNDSGTTR